MTSASRRNIVLAIDVEPDARHVDRTDSWDGVAITVREIERLRQNWGDTTGAAMQVHWFLRCDPQIAHTWGRTDWLGKACPGFVEKMLGAGDGMGVHPHFWKWDSDRGRWFNELWDRRWWAECLDVSIDGYRRLTGEVPVASRFGDRFFAQELVALLASRGIRYDLTLEPGVPQAPVFDDARATGLLPDYRVVPRVPYRPSAADYRVAASEIGGPDLWMVPVTTTDPPRLGLVRYFPFVVQTSRTMNLVLRPKMLWRYLEGWLSEPVGPAPLVLVLRAGDLSRPGYLASFGHLTSQLSRHPGLARCRFVRVETAVEDFYTAGMR